MNEEIMNNENYVEEVETDAEFEAYEETCNSDGGLLKKIVIGGVLAGGAALLVANRKKIAAKVDSWRIGRLEKKGYLVSHISDSNDRSETVIEDDEVCESEIIEG